MSHVTEMSVDVDPKKINEFVDALKEYFGEDGVEVSLDDPIQLKSWQGGNLDSRSAWGAAPKCHIVVRKATQERKVGHDLAVNDLGYHIKDGKVTGYVDTQGFSRVNQDNVVMDYASRVAAKQLKKQGYTVKTVKENGVVKLKASKYM